MSLIKKGMMFLILTGMLMSCSKNDNKDSEVDGLVGRWKLVEFLADPGDGSGVFQPVISNKIIEVYNNGAVSSNGDLCSMSSSINMYTSGTYSLTNLTITTGNCDLTFSYNGNELILYYPCIEPCAAKYERQSL